MVGLQQVLDSAVPSNIRCVCECQVVGARQGIATSGVNTYNDAMHDFKVLGPGVAM